MDKIYQGGGVILLAMILGAVSACGSSHSPSSESGAVRLKIQIKDTAIPAKVKAPRAINCETSNIAEVTANVRSASGTQTFAQGGPWPCSSESGRIKDVPIRNDLTVEVKGLDAAKRTIYYGRTSNVTISRGYITPVEVILAPVPPTPIVSLVKDLNPGASGSIPHHLTAFNHRLYFVARHPDFGFELFVTDGTDGGTQLLKDTYPHPVATPAAEEMPEPSDMTVCNGLLYFIADDGVYGPGLWQTDGTAANTRMIEGFEGTGVVNPSNLIALDDQLFFSAEHSAHGRELWQSDGTAAGTQLVEDIFAGVESSNPHELTVMRNWLYFVADDGQHGYEIWRTDGTTTAMVQDIDSNAVPDGSGRTKASSPSDLTVVDNQLYFRAVEASLDDEIWMIRADDNYATAALVKDLNPNSSSNSRPRFLTAIGDTYLAFSVRQVNEGESTSEEGTEPWLIRRRGNTEPFLLEDINYGSASSSPGNFITSRGVLYFTANNSHNEEHLWAWPFDSMEEPTSLTSDLINPAPRDLVVLEGRLYFTAFEDRSGRELWYTDGAAAERVTDLCPGACSSFPSDFTVLDDQLFFSAYQQDSGKEIYRLDHEYPSEP